MIEACKLAIIKQNMEEIWGHQIQTEAGRKEDLNL